MVHGVDSDHRCVRGWYMGQGAVVLPPMLHSPDVRWVVAAGFGVAAAALAALWGHWFATRDTSAAEPTGKSVTASGAESIAAGGDISGSASTGGRKPGPGRATRRRGATNPAARSARVTAS